MFHWSRKRQWLTEASKSITIFCPKNAVNWKWMIANLSSSDIFFFVILLRWQISRIYVPPKKKTTMPNLGREYNSILWKNFVVDKKNSGCQFFLLLYYQITRVINLKKQWQYFKNESYRQIIGKFCCWHSSCLYKLRRHLLGHISILYAGVPDATLFHENCGDNKTFPSQMSPYRLSLCCVIGNVL